MSTSPSKVFRCFQAGRTCNQQHLCAPPPPTHLLALLPWATIIPNCALVKPATALPPALPPFYPSNPPPLSAPLSLPAPFPLRRPPPDVADTAVHVTIQVMELMVRDMGQLSYIECSVKRQKWTHVLQALKLTPHQREQLMGLRKSHLNKLRAVFQDRQQLNSQVRAPCRLSQHAAAAYQCFGGLLGAPWACALLRHDRKVEDYKQPSYPMLHSAQSAMLELSYFRSECVLKC